MQTAPCSKALHGKHIPQSTVHVTKGIFGSRTLHAAYSTPALALTTCVKQTLKKAILCRCAGVIHLSSPKISSKGAYVRWSKSLPGQQVCVLAVCCIFLDGVVAADVWRFDRAILL